MKHNLLDAVTAIPCWGIYADYNANAPDTQTFFNVATEELAEEVCAFLNEDARRWNMAFVDGCESCKSWQKVETLEFVKNSGTILRSLDAVKAYLRDNDHWDEDEDEDEDES
jgi:hypothetical protein